MMSSNKFRKDGSQPVALLSLWCIYYCTKFARYNIVVVYIIHCSLERVVVVLQYIWFLL